MAYNKKNYYKKVIAIQEIVLSWQKIGLTNTKIYELHVKDQFHISKSTFDTYLGVPAVRDLNILEKKEAEKSNQLDLFNDL